MSFLLHVTKQLFLKSKEGDAMREVEFSYYSHIFVLEAGKCIQYKCNLLADEKGIVLEFWNV